VTPYWSDDACTLYLGDSREVLAELPEASVDAMVTDPPAGIAFMGRAWDEDKGGRRQWIAWLTEIMVEAYRVLKPGGHALVWALPRTSHWTATALEDAGFEIRDCIVHLFGSGFPKSLDVGKAIDRTRDDRADVLRVTAWLAQARDRAGWANRQIDEAFGMNGMAGHWTSVKSQPAVPTWEQWERLRELIGFGPEMDAEVWRLNGRKGLPGDAWFEREVIAERTLVQGGGTSLQLRVGDRREVEANITAPATPNAQRWHGWGTALKPGQEHWWLVRKPLAGAVANTVLTYGTGALNVDGCRVGLREARPLNWNQSIGYGGSEAQGLVVDGGQGRWPTNVVFTHSATCVEGEACQADCPVGELDQQSGNRPTHTGGRSSTTATRATLSGPLGVAPRGGYNETGGASRFFPTFRYQAKAPASERPRLDDGTAWPTVKPVSLMRWLVRLVTPPGGLVVDPFSGSGTTGEACAAEGFRCILVDRDVTAAELTKVRLSKTVQAPLAFSD